ncbi:MAG TPA: MdtA/MuxA family multidrug efflux RND transporter periplasmic adaptor subunit [Pirellulales bacterium]|jgi:multidrug efflux system membrane fusion protein|nr:MdtA/MuxA family multidrug efflux RND transporter periplasmic adaptor subunit [Pirellulales bacterium]
MSTSKMTDPAAHAALAEHAKAAPPAPESPPKPAPQATKPPPRLAAPAPTRSWWPTLLTLCIAGAAVYFAWPWLPWLIALTSHGGKDGHTIAKPPRAVPVVTAAVRRDDMDLYLNGLGTVTAFNTVTVRSRVEGELVRVAFTEGQMVDKGDLLAEIDPRPFEVQLAQAQGQFTKDQAMFKAAKLTLGRYNELLTTRSVTPQQIDEQIALVDQSEGAIQTDQAQIDNARLQLTYCKIIAPVSGRIGLRLVDPGNIVRANDPNGIAVVTQLQPIALVFTIPQDEISRVQRKFGEERELAVDAYDRDFAHQLAAGKLLAIDNQVDSMTGTVRLKAVFANEDNLLFPNQFVNARLLIDVKRQATIAPAAAVQRGPDSTFVYVVKSDETVELRKVAIGPVEGDRVSIESGLSPGEIVVTDGVDKLQPGAKVALRERQPERAAPAPRDGDERLSPAAIHSPPRSVGAAR